MSKLFGTLGVKAYGIAFLALCIFFVWATYAIFTKQFVDYDEVALESSKTGLSLPSRADVKIRGVIVGEVLETKTDGDGAVLTLGLYPEQREIIPANVSASILPKTLFGEKFVSLDIPDNPADKPIQPGDTISQSDVALEIEAVLNDLFPLLRTVRPADLNYTLTAIANALEGRGNKLGNGLERLDTYLKRVNPELPALLESLDRLGEVSQTYEAIVPDLTRLLRNTVKTTNTFQSKEDEIQALFDDVAGFAGKSRQFLKRNGDNMITLANQGAQIFPLLARYAPEYRCFLRGAVESIPRNEQAFRDKILHIILETLPRQPRGFTPADKPAWNDNRGPFPYCNKMYDAINGRYNQENLPPRSLASPRIQDGTEYPLNKRTAVGDAIIGSAQQREVLNLAAAPVLGVQPDEVPDIATLLLGPVARGMEVNVR